MKTPKNDSVASPKEEMEEVPAKAKATWGKISDTAPKFHRPVSVRAPGKDPVTAKRKPEGWYRAEDDKSLDFDPVDFKPLADPE